VADLKIAVASYRASTPEKFSASRNKNGGKTFSAHDDKRKQQGDDMHKYLVCAAVGIVGVFALATSASAAIVCNADGDCWRVKEKYDYRPDWGLTVYGDDWKWEGDKYRWREPGAGRGYYRGGVWIPF
jgi:hypothetical protein